MSVDKSKTSSLWAILLASFSSQAMAVFPDVDSMLEALRPTAAATAPELNTLIIAIDALPTEQQKFDALQTIIPSADGSLRAASEGPMNQLVAVVNDRLMRVAHESGVSSGDEVKKTEAPKDANPKDIHKGVWVQILGNNTGQDLRDNVPGYDADVAGILIGRDHLFNDQFAMGLAGGYTWADVDSRGPSGSFLEIKRFQGTLYAGYQFICPFYVHGAFTVAHNDYDNNRKILVPPVGGVPIVNIAWSDFSAWETDAYLETGFIWQKGHFRAIPKIMLSYSHFDVGGYIEQDAFGLDLDVKYDDMDFLPLGAGFKFEYQNEFDAAFVVPEMHAYAFHDFINDKQTATALFTGGGFEFLSQGAEPAETSFEVGAGIAVHSYKNTGVVIQYDFVTREDYHRHQAFIKVRHEWA